MSKMQRNSKIEWVPLGKMVVSEFAQREAKQYRIDALLANFDPDRLGMPVLSARDGRYYIIDGQHRVAALKEWSGAGREQVSIECQVFSGMTESQEAEMFLQLNDTLQVNMYDKFTKAITAKRLLECAIKATVEAQGLTISKCKTPGSVSAVGTLVKVYKRSDGQVLGRALRIIRDAYGDVGLEAAVIDGIGHLCQRYNGQLDEGLAKERLSAARGGVKGLLNRATDIHLRTGHTKSLCIAAAAVDVINSGRGRHVLPSWWRQ